MFVVTELSLVNISVGRLWDGLSAGGTRADDDWKACSWGERRGRRKGARDAHRGLAVREGDWRLEGGREMRLELKVFDA
jgi:hypothetical protein